MTTICSRCGKLRHIGKECFPEKAVHSYPTTTQGMDGFVTACGIKSDDEWTSPILARVHDIEKITCVSCKLERQAVSAAAES